MSDATDPSDPRDEALAQAISGALTAQVGAVDVPADAWARLDARRAAGERAAGPRTWARTVIPTLAVAAATVLLVGVGAALRGPSPSIETTVPATTPPVVSVMPDTDPSPGPDPDAGATPDPGPRGVPDPTATTAVVTPPTTARPVPTSWADVDLGSLTLPTAACHEPYRLPEATFTLVGGWAGSPPDRNGLPFGPPWFGVELLAPATFGDLDADGRDEAVIRIVCYIPNSDGLSTSVVVLRLVDGVPTVAGLLPESGTDAVVLRPWVDDDRSPVTVRTEPAGYDSAADVVVDGGLLRVRWNQYSLGIPGFVTTVHYRVGDGRPTIVGEPTRVPVPVVDFHAIRSTDVRSMTLPLASRRLCATFLEPLGPLSDARLVGGSANLTAADGRPVDGSITVTDVRYGDVVFDLFPDPDPARVVPHLEEAVLLVSCRRGSQAEVVPAVVSLRDGRPELVADLGPVIHMAGASAVEAKAQTTDVVVTWDNGAVTAYDWNGSAFVKTAIPRW